VEKIVLKRLCSPGGSGIVRALLGVPKPADGGKHEDRISKFEFQNFEFVADFVLRILN
jgi:hypothetical protein